MILKRHYIYVFMLGLVLTGKVYAAGSGALRVELPDAGPFGMGSAFVGEADRPSAVYYNPAGMTQMKKEQFSDGFAFFAPQLYYKDPSGLETKAHEDTYYIPSFYSVMPIHNSKAVVGVGVTSSWGSGINWPEKGILRYDATKGSLENDDGMLAIAYPITDHWSLAASFDLDYSKADINKKIDQSGDPSDLSHDANSKLKAQAFGWGYRFATMYKFNDQNQLGLMYRSVIREDYKGNIYLDGLDNSGNDLKTTFGGSSYQNDVREALALPQSVVMGYSFRPTSKWTLNADLEWMDWRSVHQQLLVFGEKDPVLLSILNSGNPTVDHWKAVWSEAVGAQYAWTDRFRVRCGYYHIQTPIASDTFDASLPDSNVNGVTVGFGYDIFKRLTLDFAYSADFYEARSIVNTVDAADNGVNGNYHQFTNLVLMTITYKFK